MSAEKRHPRPRALRQNKRALFVVGALGALALLAEAAALMGFFRPAPPPPGPGRPEDHWQYLLKAEAPPPPRTWPAAVARLSNDAEVVGVSVNGQHRAYPLSALAKGPTHHVVNDLVGGTPLSVAYCNIHDCVQVVAGAGDQPLQLRVAGLDMRSMLVAVGEHRYRESTLEPLDPGAPAFPYRRHAWERTTWRSWRGAHPDTEVFLGQDAAPDPPPGRGG
jgi:hypothetical protein